MKLFVSSIYDAATETWSPPLFTRSKGEVFRWFSESVNNVDVKFARHPGDYSLFELGSWDDGDCKFELLKAPVRLALALELQDPSVTQALKEATIEAIKQKTRGSGGVSAPA